MTSLRRLFLNSAFALVTLFVASAPLRAAASAGITYEITKSLIGATGNANATGNEYTVAFAFGETISGNEVFGQMFIVQSGFYGGRFGTGQTFQVTGSDISGGTAKTFYQDGLRVGVPLNATIAIDFSDQLLATNLPRGLAMYVATDHLAREQNTPAPFVYTVDPGGKRLVITPETTWSGNTLYDIVLTPNLLSIDGFSLEAVTHIQFLTVLDPREENVVFQVPSGQGSSVGAPGNAASKGLMVHIPAEALADFSAVLFSRDPVSSPLSIDPGVVSEASRKATAAGGAYRTPIAIQEINAFDLKGARVSQLSKPAEILMAYDVTNGMVQGVDAPVEAHTLSLWALDETHRLWVKLPESERSADSKTVSAPIHQLATFALMGAPSNTTADVFVFPVPWRPHGPNAGTGAGQTGTETDGILFSNLPSECTIRIYTVSGEKVRELHHSNLVGPIGQERWNGKTSGGDVVASGVYLWRVESATDGKNGKLMIIR